MGKSNILYIFAEPFAYGGQEAFAINIYKKINKKKFNITFYTPFKCENKEIESLLNENGDRIIYDNYEFNTKMRKKYFVDGVKKIIKNSDYDVVHIHSGSTFSLSAGAKIVKNNTNALVIVHSHATGNHNLKHSLIKKISKKTFLNNVDYFFACSREAALWKFPKNVVNSEKCMIIKNGIDVSKFSFSPKIRKKYREEMGFADNELIICHIGRFSKEKNHIFLLKIFKELLKLDSNSKLLLIGSGELKNKIYNYAKCNNLLKKVIFLDVRTDVSELLQASDVFVFPSIYEGLGIAAIEAQAVGLPTICSDSIPNETNITENFYQLSLKELPNVWAEKIIDVVKHKRKTFDINKIKNQVIERGYDVGDTTKIIEKIYIKE